MIYQEYAEIRGKYRKAQRTLEGLLSEKEKLFMMTQPKSTMGEYEREYDKQISVGSKGGSKINSIEEYVIRLEESGIDERLAEAKSLLREWEILFVAKERELRQSKDIDDVLYVMRFLDHLRVKDIARRTHYSKQQTYKRLKKIMDTIG